jgi:hypothetical protein
MKMPKRRLAAILGASMSLVVAVNLGLVLGLASDHKAYVIPALFGIASVIPGFVVATLAWRGRLRSRCWPSG